MGTEGPALMRFKPVLEKLWIFEPERSSILWMNLPVYLVEFLHFPICPFTLNFRPLEAP